MLSGEITLTKTILHDYINATVGSAALPSGRAGEHLRLWRNDAQLLDHLFHAVTRLLMALTLPELV